MQHSRYPTAALLGIAALVVGGVFALFIFLTDSTPVIQLPAPPPNALVRASTEPATLQETPHSIILEVVAYFSGARPEEVERQVAIPLEKSLAGIPHLESLWSKSGFGVCRLHAHFQPDITYDAARNELDQRITAVEKLQPVITHLIAANSSRHSLHYVLISPHDEKTGKQIYMLRDLRALQEQVLEREFRTVPGVVDCWSSGGVVKRFEIHPDPDRLRRLGVTFSQLETALANCTSGDDLIAGKVNLNVRNVGLFGSVPNPLTDEVLKAGTPEKADYLLRIAEKKQILVIRNQAVATVGGQTIHVEDVVEGGRVRTVELGLQGVVVGGKPRLDQVVWDGEDAVAGDVFLRAAEDLKAMSDVRERIRNLNANRERLLPGVRIETYYDSTKGGAHQLWMYGILPTAFSLEQANELARTVNELLHKLPEVDRVVDRFRGDGFGTNTQSFNEVRFFASLKQNDDEPGARQQLISEIQDRLTMLAPGVAWLTTTRDPLEMDRTFPGAPADHLLMLVGPDLEELERLSTQVEARLKQVTGIESVGVFHGLGQPRMRLDIDPEKCKKLGVKPEDVKNVIQSTLTMSTVEGEVIRGELALSFPPGLKKDDNAILDIPIDVFNNQNDPIDPAKTNAPRIRLRDLVSPPGKDGKPDANKSFDPSPNASVIYRKDGKRLLPIRFSVKGRPLAEVQAEAAKKIAPVLKEPYRIEWSE